MYEIWRSVLYDIIMKSHATAVGNITVHLSTTDNNSCLWTSDQNQSRHRPSLNRQVHICQRMTEGLYLLLLNWANWDVRCGQTKASKWTWSNYCIGQLFQQVYISLAIDRWETEFTLETEQTWWTDGNLNNSFNFTRHHDRSKSKKPATLVKKYFIMSSLTLKFFILLFFWSFHLFRQFYVSTSARSRAGNPSVVLARSPILVSLLKLKHITQFIAYI